MVKIKPRIELISILLPILTVFGWILSCPAQSDISSQLEPVYAEAVLAYNGRDFNKSLQILDQLVKQEPNTPEFLELKALILKTTHDDKGSALIYQDLIRVKKENGSSAKEIAPYQFELGVIRFRESNYAEARISLEESLKSGFNESPCHFFLGMMDFRDAHWSDAESHFSEVASGNTDELIPASHFYLGQIFLKVGSPTSATQNFFFARREAMSQKDDSNLSPDTRKIAKQIFDATEGALKPFDRSGFFGSVSMLTAEDTNVLLQGTGIAGINNSSSSPSNISTIKETLLASVGYSSSPISTFQVVPSFRTAYNFNFNSSTASGEYLVNDFSFYLTKNALARRSYGLKLEGLYTFQDQPDSNNARNYSSYSMVASLGPYFRFEIKPKWILNVEVYGGPQKFFGDSALSSTAPNLVRTGGDVNGKVSVKNDNGNRFWNPGASFMVDRSITSGSEFNSLGLTSELNDVMHLSDSINLNLAGDLGHLDYYRSPNPSRSDFVFNLDASGTYKMSQHLSFIADVQYTVDSVSCSDAAVVAQYQYNRLVASLGFSYIF